ncbi:sugar ABC transporter ATP-binding protein [Endozoicomonas ascidiicola]|uniref:sugar ABC transporter ATP-binding protein n=2 Tax=Endozoicomonas ascidiicola TaxID=1698521 RepID=UPI000BA2BF47|nr:sugar ABC transporter ATP-binding protein [Endozoicomonas ascidiicola]
MHGILKSFGSVNVLKDVQLTIADSEVHALMGENGAGKSTLIKILSGVYSKDAGDITVDGVTVDSNDITSSQELGIAYVHQELNVVNELSIADNMFLGKEIKNRYGFIDRTRMNEVCEGVLKELNFSHLSPDTLMGDISVGSQQMIEIAKALLINARLIILDEPTAALTNKEIESLFKIIRKLKSEGVSFLYVSHRMNEIFELSDQITVLRDGCYVGTRETAQVTEDDLVEMMTGKSIDNLFPDVPCKPGKTILEVNGLTQEKYFKNVSFDLKEGEVLGFAGLMGSGRSEVMHAIFGSKPVDSGEIRINGQPVSISSPIIAKQLGLAFVTEDRKEEGLILDFDLIENTSLPSLHNHTKNGFVDDKKLTSLTDQYIRDIRIKTSSSKQKLKNLSGGNQQKVVLAKWLETAPQILILDEPTRGVDVGAKKEIYEIINELKSKGVAIIVVSSELSEVMGISDRLAVMHQGSIVNISPTKQMTQDQVLKLAFTGAH